MNKNAHQADIFASESIHDDPDGAYIGIVGSEAAKFTEHTKRLAMQEIERIISIDCVVVSGACHLGGIDDQQIRGEEDRC